MCTRPQDIRERLLQEEGGAGDHQPGRTVNGGGGDGYTLLQEMGGGGILTSQSPFLLRFSISSIVLITLLLLSTQSTWVAFLYEIAKPVYFVYVVGITIVDFLGPVLSECDWLLISPFSITSAEEPIYSEDQQATRTEDNNWRQNASETLGEYLQGEPTTGTSQISKECNAGQCSSLNDHASNGENNDNSIFQVADEPVNPAIVPDLSAGTNTKAKNRSWIPAPLKNGRKVKSRGRPTGQEETNVQLLRALESEIRKNVKTLPFFHKRKNETEAPKN